MFQLDYSDARPLYEQIKDKLKTLILRGILLPDQQLPSVRELAANLTLNPNTIQKAYRDLEAEGYVYSVRGKGNFVAKISLQLKESQQQQLKSQLGEVIRAMTHSGVTLQQALGWVQEIYQAEGGTPA